MSHSRLVLAQFALSIRFNIPPQEEPFRPGQMLSTEVDDLAAEWAMRGDVRMLLQKLLDRPYDEVLGVASVLPFGGLCDRHLVQLDALASHLETHFEAPHSSSIFAMHVWLYHLLHLSLLLSSRNHIVITLFEQKVISVALELSQMG